MVGELKARLDKLDLPAGLQRAAAWRVHRTRGSHEPPHVFAAAALALILLLLQTSFRSWRLAVLSLLTLPVALVGGVIAAYISGGVLSLGSVVGFLTVMGIAARNGILLINHCQHLERNEGEHFGRALVMRGASERLSPILMTTLATGAGSGAARGHGQCPGP